MVIRKILYIQDWFICPIIHVFIFPFHLFSSQRFQNKNGRAPYLKISSIIYPPSAISTLSVSISTTEQEKFPPSPLASDRTEEAHLNFNHTWFPKSIMENILELDTREAVWFYSRIQIGFMIRKTYYQIFSWYQTWSMESTLECAHWNNVFASWNWELVDSCCSDPESYSND